ncbi:hypothetical protein D9M68_986570 [compost metagenome]
MAQHERLPFAVAQAMCHAQAQRLRQPPREVGRAGHRQGLQRLQHGGLARQHGVARRVARELDRHALGHGAEPFGQQHLAVLTVAQRRKHAVVRAAPLQEAAGVR